MTKNPEECASMAEVRAAIDTLDAEIVGLLAKRVYLIDRASELKSENGWPARISERVEEVAQNARKNADAAGLDSDLAERLWRELIEWSITREARVLGPNR